MRPQRMTFAAVCAATILAVFPALAQAGRVDLYDDPYGGVAGLYVSAYFGETNAVVLDGDSHRVMVTDRTAPLDAGEHCVATGPGAAVCTVPGGRRLNFVQTYLADGQDRLTDNVVGLQDDPFDGAPGSHYDNGGDGRDNIVGSDGDVDFIDGGNGSDVARGRGGDDVLTEYAFEFGAETGDEHYFGGSGDDTLDGGLGADFLDGGPGIDTVRYDKQLKAGAPGVRIDLRGTSFGNGQPGENDILVNEEDATGTNHNDTLIGSSGGNVLDGRSGDDAITGNGAADTLFGRAGADDLQAQDGEADQVSCGGPSAGDRAAVDAVDAVAGCPAEGAGLNTRPSSPPGSGNPASGAPASATDDQAPAITVTVAGRIKRRALIRRGVTVRVRSGDAVRDRVTGTLSTRPRITRARAGDLILAERQASFLRRTTIRLKPSRRLRRAVRRGSRLRLLIVVRDPAGNRTSRTVRIRVT